MPSTSNYYNVSICMFPLFLLLCFTIPCIDSSTGDRSEAYRRCLYFCGRKNCLNSTNLANFENVRPWYLSALSWECWDECEYDCMWYVVKALKTKGYPIPQFHGKWPFIRFYGVQEPASVLFSILNGISHLFMFLKFKKSVQNVPDIGIWNVQAMLSVNAWFWSAVFHTRDTPLTEKLDYFCAFSLVLYSFYCLLIKLLSRRKSQLPKTLGLMFISLFAYHVYYLMFVKFDYGYNLVANVVVGLLNSVGWIFWCFLNRRKQYIWKCAASIIGVNLLLLLELGDFPPWGFLVDAHALWHLGTIPVPILWYSFLIDDYSHKDHSL